MTNHTAQQWARTGQQNEQGLQLLQPPYKKKQENKIKVVTK